MKWHDGCDFTADDVVKYDPFDQRQGAEGSIPRDFARRAPLSGNYAERQQAGRPHRGVRHEGAGFALPLSDQLRAADQPMPRQGSEIQLGGLRLHPSDERAPVRVRHSLAAGAWSWFPTPPLEPSPRAEAGLACAGTDARGLHAHRGTAVGAGELDQERRPDGVPAEIRRHADRHEPLPAQLDVSAQLRKRPVHRQAGPPGGELRAEPRGHEGAAEDRLMLEGYSTVPPSTPYYDAIRKNSGNRSSQGQGVAEGSGLPAVQGDLRHLDLRFRPDAAAADERAGEVADGCRRLRRDAEHNGLECIAGCHACRREQESDSMSAINVGPEQRGTVQRLHTAMCGRHNGRRRAATGVTSASLRPSTSSWRRKSTASSIPAKRLFLLTKLNEQMDRDLRHIFIARPGQPPSTEELQGYVQPRAGFRDRDADFGRSVSGISLRGRGA